MSDPVAMVIAALAAPTAANIGVLVTGLLLGIRHGIDWDHIAAITDITSTTAAAGTAEAAHVEQHREISGQHHGHGGQLEMRAHDAGPGAATLAPATSGGGVAGSWKPVRAGRGHPPRHAVRARPRLRRDRARHRGDRCSGRSCPSGSTR